MARAYTLYIVVDPTKQETDAVAGAFTVRHELETACRRHGWTPDTHRLLRLGVGTGGDELRRTVVPAGQWFPVSAT